MNGARERRRRHLTHTVLLASLLLATPSLPTVVQAQSPASPSRSSGRLTVRIVSPDAGVVEGPEVQFEARVSDPRIQHATLVMNGASYDVPVEQGRIRQNVVAVPGNNRVGVVVRSGQRVARDSLTFLYRGPPVELMVLLTWPSEGEIIDLWVREPEGETCKWDHRSTESGGRLLDFSADAIGFGSQAYVLSRVRAGRFRIKLHYWGAWADDDQRGWYQYERLLSQLERLEQRLSQAPAPQRASLERRVRALRRRLDRWSRPAAPQTPVRAEVVLFPGTAAERRWRFERTVQRTGQLMSLGEVAITDAMVRNARGSQ